jgi:hypothetical protein
MARAPTLARPAPPARPPRPVEPAEPRRDPWPGSRPAWNSKALPRGAAQVADLPRPGSARVGTELVPGAVCDSERALYRASSGSTAKVNALADLATIPLSTERPPGLFQRRPSPAAYTRGVENLRRRWPCKPRREVAF